MSDAEGPCDGALGVGKVERRDVQQPALVEHPPAVVTRGAGWLRWREAERRDSLPL